jgi:hypothetical protein
MTAIEWLFNMLWKTPQYETEWQKLLEQAKQIEKEQIEIAWWNGHDTRDSAEMSFPSEDCNGYYNETYGSKGSDETKTN